MADQDELTVHLTVTANQAHARIPLKVTRSDNAAVLRQKVASATKIPLPLLKLIFRGRMIPDDASKLAVEEFKMEEGSVLHCMGKPVVVDNAASSGAASTTTTGTVPAAAVATAATTAMPAGSTVSFQPSTNIPAQPPADPLAAALVALRASHTAAVYATAVSTLEKILANIIQNPMEDKYRKVKKQNAAFQRRLGGLAGGDAAMKAAGFIAETANGEDVYMMQASADAWPQLLATKATLEARVREAKAAANQATAPPLPMGNMPAMPGGTPGMGGMPGGMPGMGGPDMQNAMANVMSDPVALQRMMQNPMVQQMVRNDPRFANNPMLLESMQQLASNPAMAGQFSQMMRDPNMQQQIQSMVQQHGGGGGNLPGAGGGTPLAGGFSPGAGGAPPHRANNSTSTSANPGQPAAPEEQEQTEEEMIAEAIRRSLQDGSN